MGSTFKFWLIANFEICIFVLTIIIGIIMWSAKSDFSSDDTGAHAFVVLLYGIGVLILLFPSKFLFFK